VCIGSTIIAYEAVSAIIALFAVKANEAVLAFITLPLQKEAVATVIDDV
jgi:hypothetical protein